jgi:hypothetical protein
LTDNQKQMANAMQKRMHERAESRRTPPATSREHEGAGGFIEVGVEGLCGAGAVHPEPEGTGGT